MKMSLNGLLNQVSQSGNADKTFGYDTSKTESPKTGQSKGTGTTVPLKERKITVLNGDAKTDPAFRQDLFSALSDGQTSEFITKLRGKLGINGNDTVDGEKTLQGREIKELINEAAQNSSNRTQAKIDALYWYMPMDGAARTMIANYAKDHFQDETVREFLKSAGNGKKDTKAQFLALAKLAQKILDERPSVPSTEMVRTYSYLSGVISSVRLIFEGPSEKPEPKPEIKQDEQWADNVVQQYTAEKFQFSQLLATHLSHLRHLPKTYQVDHDEKQLKELQTKLEKHWEEFRKEMTSSAKFRQKLLNLYEFRKDKDTGERAVLTSDLVFKAFCEFVCASEANMPPKCPVLPDLNTQLHKDDKIGVLKENLKEVLEHKAHAQTRGGNRCQMLSMINSLLQKESGKAVLEEYLTEVDVDMPPDGKGTTQTVKKKAYKFHNPKYIKSEQDSKEFIYVTVDDIAGFKTSHIGWPELSHFEKVLLLAVEKTNSDSIDPNTKLSTFEDVPQLFGLQVNKQFGSISNFKGTNAAPKTEVELKAELLEIKELIKAEQGGVTFYQGNHYMAVTDVYFNDAGDYGVVCLDSSGDRPEYVSRNLAGKVDYNLYAFGDPHDAKNDHPWTL